MQRLCRFCSDSAGFRSVYATFCSVCAGKCKLEIAKIRHGGSCSHIGPSAWSEYNAACCRSRAKVIDIKDHEPKDPYNVL